MPGWLPVLGLAAVSALAACSSNAPMCRYWTDAPISKGALDPSAVPMLPYNHYWDGRSASGAAPQDVCAGEPGHPARMAD